MTVFWQGLRYGLRSLLRNPGFSAVVTLALALSIGPNRAIVTVVHAALFKPSPIPPHLTAW